MRVCVFSFLAMSSLSVAFVVSPRYCCSSYLTLFLLSFLIHLWKYELLISLFSLYYYWIATWLCSSFYLHTTFIVYTPMSFPLKSLTQYQKETTTCHFYATVYWLLLDYFPITWLTFSASWLCEWEVWLCILTCICTDMSISIYGHLVLIKRLYVLVKPFWPYPTPPKTFDSLKISNNNIK